MPMQEITTAVIVAIGTICLMAFVGGAVWAFFSLFVLKVTNDKGLTRGVRIGFCGIIAGVVTGIVFLAYKFITWAAEVLPL